MFVYTCLILWAIMSAVKQQSKTLYLSGNFSFPIMVIAAYTCFSSGCPQAVDHMADAGELWEEVSQSHGSALSCLFSFVKTAVKIP